MAGAGNGYFYEPTIISNVKEGVRIVDEEQFGPVLPIPNPAPMILSLTHKPNHVPTISLLLSNRLAEAKPQPYPKPSSIHRN
jgi:hypothetical protein